jgi:NAD(P)H-hydrate epimerase
VNVPHLTEPIPYLTVDQMREVDRAMVEDYGISLLQMMENAGRSLAHLAVTRFLGGDPRGKQVTALCGTGGNGGGGLVCARHLHNRGASVTVVTTRPEEDFHGVPARQLAILRNVGLPVIPVNRMTTLPPADLLLDAVIGYGLSGKPHGAAAEMIRRARAQDAPILSLDVPSGLDATTGATHEPTVRATATLTLALPKTGLRPPEARAFTGACYLADISVPPELYVALGLTDTPVPLFFRAPILRLW